MSSVSAPHPLKAFLSMKVTPSVSSILVKCLIPENAPYATFPPVILISVKVLGTRTQMLFVSEISCEKYSTLGPVAATPKIAPNTAYPCALYPASLVVPTKGRVTFSIASQFCSKAAGSESTPLPIVSSRILVQPYNIFAPMLVTLSGMTKKRILLHL